MVGGGQAEPVGETQAAHAAEIKCVAMGNGPAFATISAGRRAAGAWVLAPAAYVVTGTPESRESARRRREVEEGEAVMIRKVGSFFFCLNHGNNYLNKRGIRGRGEEGEGGLKISRPAKSHCCRMGTACCSSVSLWIRLPQNPENTFCWDNRCREIIWP